MTDEPYIAQQGLLRKITKDLSKLPRNFKDLVFKKKKKVILSWDTTKLDKSHSQRGQESKKAASLNGSIYLWSLSAGPRMQSACQDERRLSALGNRREPSLQGQPSPMGAAHDKNDTSTTSSIPRGDSNTFLHLSSAPHINLSTLSRQDSKALRSVSTGLWILFSGVFFNSYFIFYSSSLLMHRTPTDRKCLVCPEWSFIHR